MAPVRKRNPAGPFSKEQEIWIVLEFGACRNITQVGKNFGKYFFKQTRQLFHEENC